MSPAPASLGDDDGDRAARQESSRAPIRERIKSRGILTAGGLGPYESVGFRIGHMGDIRVADVERTLDALTLALDEAISDRDPARVADAATTAVS